MEKETDLISVVVVTYNSSDTIIETLESIKEQTYTRLELIVSDDASQDDTVRIVKKWIEKNKEYFIRIRVLAGRKNHGVAKNCNIAIHQAKGKYVQLVAGDDLLIETAIEKKYNFASENRLKVVYCKVEPFGKSYKLVNDMKRFCERGYNIIERGWECQNEKIIVDNFIAGPSGSFYDREFFINRGGFDIRFPMLEDYPFHYRYITTGNKIVLLDEVLTRYRISGKSLCTSPNIKFEESSKRFFYLVRLPELLKRKKYDVAKQQIIQYMNW